MHNAAPQKNKVCLFTFDYAPHLLLHIGLPENDGRQQPDSILDLLRPRQQLIVAQDSDDTIPRGGSVCRNS